MFSPPRLVVLFAALLQAGSAHTTGLKYPVTAATNEGDDYHGVFVPDPYRWLEDDNSAETKAWVEAQNRVTFDFLNQIPERATVKARLTQLWNSERYGVPAKHGGRYFLTKNDGLQNQSVLYTMASLNAEPRVLLDPNRLSNDGTVALSGTSISEDGNLMAYGLSAAGSDWQEWKIRDVRSGEDLRDQLKWVKFSVASWLKDGSGFFYSRFDEPKEADAMKGANFFQKLFFHRLGASQADDRLVYQRADHKDWRFNGHVTDDGRYLIITVSQGTERKNRVYYQDLQTASAPVVELLNEFDAAYNFIDNDGPVFWFRTDLAAPRGRVIGIDLMKPARANWKEIIPQTGETLTGVNFVGGQFLATHLKDAHSQVKVYAHDGKLVREVDLPGIGSTAGFDGRRADSETFYSFTSFTVPGTIYRYDLQNGTSSVVRQPRVAFDPGKFETKQIFYTSKDGARVPMFITHKRGLKLNGRNPTYLYGYGGFNISLTPAFSVPLIVWMEMGGVFAEPNLRGGGEYGREWHEAGMKLKKQNVFDDFIAAAKWLIAQKYTRPDKLVIAGRSNGGLLVGACMTQRPELFGAALPGVGVMDMLRFHKFTVGWGWTSDYGSPDNPEEFKALRAYSPLHNLRAGTKYPATLITTADHDDRVVPAHSFKFAATLQAAQAGQAPTLIRIETRAGHGAGMPTSKQIESYADQWGFLIRALKMKAPEFTQ